MNRTRLLTIAFVATLAASSIATTTLLTPYATTKNLNEADFAHGSSALPFSSLKDWRSFSDSLVNFTIVSEARLPASQEERDAGVGFETRLLTARIDQVLWTRDSTRALPSTMQFPQGGWAFSRERGTRRIYLENAPDLNIGSTYVAPICFDETQEGPLQWQPLAPGAIISSDGPLITNVEPVLQPPSANSLGMAARRALVGRTLTEAATLVSGAPEYAAAREARTDTARLRYQAVLKGKEYATEQQALR